MDLDLDARLLGIRLGLGDLNRRNYCSGYQNACPCSECRSRAKSVAPEFHAWLNEDGINPVPQLFKPPKRAPQPWDIKAA
jgi:hypothetical protein